MTDTWADEAVENVTPAGDGAGVPRVTHNARTMAAWLADPSLLTPPPVVIPYLGWHGRNTLVAAAEKYGKSTLIRQAAEAVSTGGVFLGLPVTQGVVLWLGPEEHIGDIVRGFHALHADPDNVIIATELAGLADVAALVAESRPAFTVVDTLISFAGNAISAANDSAQWRPVVQGLTDIAHRADTCMATLAHARKSDGRARDSSAITAGVDVICEMMPPSEVDARRDATLRVLDVRGRVCSRTSTTIRLTEPGALTYTLAGPLNLSVDLEVLRYVQQNAGSATRTIVDAVRRKRADVLAVLRQLKNENLIDERDAANGGKGTRWFAKPTPDDG